MILVDNTQIILGTIFAQYDSPMDVTLDLARHVTLSTYRMYRNIVPQGIWRTCSMSGCW
jgi:hypothetical protein